MAQKLQPNKLLASFPFEEKKEEKRIVTLFFLLACEGQKTEPFYFLSFPNNGKFKIEIDFVDKKGKIIKVKKGKTYKKLGGINTIEVVNMAIRAKTKSKQKYDKVWAVFDKDNFPDEDFNAAIQKAESNNIGCAWSNEAFELWYLFHFKYQNTGMKRDKYQKDIENNIKRITGDSKFKYTKNSTEMYDILQKYGNQSQAIKNAERLSNSYNNQKFATHNPRTQVYELVNQLIGKEDKKLDKEIKQEFK
ncbi:MAG: RloB family protein [Prevotellaceae bacterium]|jgi:hypothetical protein|nr:RloB family protein [Prevotellaceae bacterium]